MINSILIEEFINIIDIKNLTDDQHSLSLLRVLAAKSVFSSRYFSDHLIETGSFYLISNDLDDLQNLLLI